jgi:hypothetical protein
MWTSEVAVKELASSKLSPDRPFDRNKLCRNGVVDAWFNASKFTNSDIARA